MVAKYTYSLTADERQMLENVIKHQSGTSQKVRRAHILLKADSSPQGGNWTDSRIADAFGCWVRTIERLRKRVVEEGLDSALASKREGLSAHNRKLTGDQEAAIIATRLGEPPQGYAHWSLRLLSERVVELELVDSVSHETLRKILKKTE